MPRTSATSLVERCAARSSRMPSWHGSVRIEGLRHAHAWSPDRGRLARLRAATVSHDAVVALVGDLAALDHSRLSAADRLVVLRAWDRIAAWSQAGAARALAA